jgi:hypothetical protein
MLGACLWLMIIIVWLARSSAMKKLVVYFKRILMRLMKNLISMAINKKA